MNSGLTRCLQSAGLGLLLLLPLFAQQPNSPEASLRFNGRDGPPHPIRVQLSSQLTPALQFEIEGAPSQAYLLAANPGGTQAGALPTPFGSLDLSLPGLVFVLDGFGMQTSIFDPLAVTGPNGSSQWSVPLSATTEILLGGFQAAVQDPTSLSGVTFTAATEVRLFGAITRLHVSQSSGSDLNAGTATSPLATMDHALTLAGLLPGMDEIFVEQGSYGVTMTALPDGVDIIGGFDSTFSMQPGSPSILTAATGGFQLAAFALATRYERLKFESGSTTTTSPNSIAMMLTSHSAVTTFDECEFFASAALPGSPGASGASVASPPAANNGAQRNGGASSGGSGGGGDGGDHGQDGDDGSDAISGGAQGGNGGTGGGSPTSVTDGQPGQTGQPGAAGATGQPLASVFDPQSLSFPPQTGQAGADGSPGFPGGGGGGGGGYESTFGNEEDGGGGGAGGRGGTPGRMGHGGGNGGSCVAVVVFDSAPVFEACTFSTGHAGPGGPGGDGSSGSSGGQPGFGAPPAGSNGGRGGNGGQGGAGGAGSGGAGGSGGHTYGLLIHTTSPMGPAPTFIAPTTYSLGAPGPGAPGGMTPGSGPAPTGLSGESLDTQSF